MNNQRSVAPAAHLSDHDILVSDVAESIRNLMAQMESDPSPPKSVTAVYEALEAFANKTGRNLDSTRS